MQKSETRPLSGSLALGGPGGGDPLPAEEVWDNLADRDSNAAVNIHRVGMEQPFEPVETIPLHHISVMQVLSMKQEAPPLRAGQFTTVILRMPRIDPHISYNSRPGADPMQATALISAIRHGEI